jgi:hypothetical protein
MGRMDDGWLDTLPAELGRQWRVLRSLLDFCIADGDARWFTVSCSLARGAGDELSDVDCGIGVIDGTVGDSTGRIFEHLTKNTEIVDVLRQSWGSAAAPGVRLFVQFADGAQLDLVVMNASLRAGRAPDEVVLSDPDGLLATSFTPSPDRVTAEQIHEWTFLAWIALADANKYLVRGSVWEAHNRLHEARDRIWALWAAAKAARYPVFGLSQVLDRDPNDLPPGIEATVADLDPVRLRAAVLASGQVLELTSRLAASAFGARLPTAMAEYCLRMWRTSESDAGPLPPSDVVDDAHEISILIRHVVAPGLAHFGWRRASRTLGGAGPCALWVAPGLAHFGWLGAGPCAPWVAPSFAHLG